MTDPRTRDRPPKVRAHKMLHAGTPRPGQTKPRSKRAGARWSFGGVTISLRAAMTLVVLGVLAIVLVPTAVQWMEQEQAYRNAVAQVEEAEEHNKDLRRQIDLWEDEEFIAAQARERLGYVRPGETQFVVVDAPELEQEDVEAEAEFSGPAKPWMWKLLDSMRDADSPPPLAETSKDRGESDDQDGADG